MAELSRMTARLAMITGVLGALWMLAMTVIGGATFPGYDHASQFISELGANGAPHGLAVSLGGFLPVGVLLTAFAVCAWLAAPRSALSTIGFIGIVLFAVGYLAASYYRCDFGCRPETPSVSQQMHNAFGLLGYMFAPLCMLLLGLAARAWANAGWLAAWAFASAGLTLVGLLTLAPESPFVGWSQRLIEAGVLSWVAACGFYLGRQPRAR